ncbi:MAG: hypothetical protein A3A86_04930 [Elusimicrobia bacterium RIFCSPLOWO2_01_FULL_60_11]|nr:MAG: hypothetical protein A3A86_04930 [Elusimicrobia bacterium RIFCSPLOWO2_01_FULL_60_11]
MRSKNIAVAAVLSLILSAQAFAARFVIDPVHSDVSFKIRHMMVSKVSGRFGGFSGEVNYDDKNPAAWSAQATIDAASIDTDNANRDAHLESPDFFDVQKYPAITFKSTGVKNVSGGKAQLSGLLMMHGVEKPVVLDMEVGGVITEKGKTKAGFEAATKVNRKDFGISWNKMLDSGGVALGDEVEISIRIEAELAEAPKMPAPAPKK